MGGAVVFVGEDGELSLALEACEEAFALASVEGEDGGVVPLEADAGEGVLDGAGVGEDGDVLGAEFFDDEGADAVEEWVAGGEDTDIVVGGEFGDVVEELREGVLDDEALAGELGEES